MIAPKSNDDPTPLGRWLADLTQRIAEVGELAIAEFDLGIDFHVFENEILSQDIHNFTDVHDVAFALKLMSHIVSPFSSCEQVWNWAKAISSPFSECASVCSSLVRLGVSLRSVSDPEVLDADSDYRDTRDPSDEDEEWDEVAEPSTDEGDENCVDFSRHTRQFVSGEELERLAIKAMQIEPSNADHYDCAGELYDFLGQLDLAKSNYEHALTLDPAHIDAALHLARFHGEFQHLSQALHVLEGCIAAGGITQEVLFEAAQFSYMEKEYLKQVELLKQMHRDFGDYPLSHFCLANGYLALGRPHDAAAEMIIERDTYPTHGLHVDSLMAEINAQLGESAAAAEHIDLALAHALSKIDYLDEFGVEAAYIQLLRAAEGTSRGDFYRQRVQDRMLRMGIATDRYFLELRSRNEPCTVSKYMCYFTQPLKEDWQDDPGCFHDQVDWDCYIATWGVWARNSDEAADVALNWQTKCYEEEPILIALEETTEPQLGRPGIAFQGPRYADQDFDDFD